TARREYGDGIMGVLLRDFLTHQIFGLNGLVNLSNLRFYWSSRSEISHRARRRRSDHAPPQARSSAEAAVDQHADRDAGERCGNPHRHRLGDGSQDVAAADLSTSDAERSQ